MVPEKRDPHLHLQGVQDGSGKGREHLHLQGLQDGSRATDLHLQGLQDGSRKADPHLHLQGVQDGSGNPHQDLHLQSLQDGCGKAYEASTVLRLQAGQLHQDHPGLQVRAEEGRLHGDPLRAEGGLQAGSGPGLLRPVLLLRPLLLQVGLRMRMWWLR